MSSSYSNGRPLGSSDGHCRRSFTMKFRIDPNSFVMRCVNWRYFLRSEGTRWNLSIRSFPVHGQGLKLVFQ
jgi:hypothetical protein